MDVPTLSAFLRPIITVTSVFNTGETGDINSLAEVSLQLNVQINISLQNNNNNNRFKVNFGKNSNSLTNLNQNVGNNFNLMFPPGRKRRNLAFKPGHTLAKSKFKSYSEFPLRDTS